MPFNINEFKSRIDAFGGPAKPSLFTVEFSNIPKNNFMSERDLLFFCQTVVIPGIEVETISYRRNALDLNQEMPTAFNAEPVSCIFMMDSDHKLLSFFHRWAQEVVNYSTQAGNFSSVQDQLPYEIGYKDDYSCRMVIKYYSTDATGPNSGFYEVILDGVYPTKIDSVDLAWENNDSFSTLPVSFSYNRIQYSAERVGSPTERLSRGNGLIQLISTIGTTGQLVGQDLVPQSIQDAINKYTRVRNTITGLSNIFN